MRTIRFTPTDLTETELVQWAGCQKKANDATNKVITEWEAWLRQRANNIGVKEFNPILDHTIWRDVIKNCLFEKVFHKKCVYCESLLVLDRYFGDVDHFRPKGRVTSKNTHKSGDVVYFRPTEPEKNIKICARRERVFVSIENICSLHHPGYFWLAYDWRNLMPVCSICNSRAKGDQFPIDEQCLLMVRLTSVQMKALLSQPINSKQYPDFFYLSPPDLDQQEKPLILNPLNPPIGREPQEHIRFGIGGCVVAVDDSPLGNHTITVLKLDREELNTLRHEAQENIRNLFIKVMCKEVANDCEKFINNDEQFLDAPFSKYNDGDKAYSAAALDHLDFLKESLRRKLRENKRQDISIL